MKTLIAALLLLPLMVTAAENAAVVDAARADKTVNAPLPPNAVVVMRVHLGSGTPGFVGFEPAVHLGDGVYHAPQYMPFYPTAGVIWPRVVEVECEKADDVFSCNGYDWLPALGRGEYLYIRPFTKVAPPATPDPVVIVVPGPERTRIILKEVPAKKQGG